MDPNSAKIENFKNLKTYVCSYSPEAIYERFQDHTLITGTRVFLKLKNSIFWHKMDPNSAQNKNSKNPKTYVSLYTQEAILWAISGPYIDHWDPSFFKREKSIFFT